MELLDIKAYVSNVLIDTGKCPLKKTFKIVALYVMSESALFYIILPTQDFISLFNFCQSVISLIFVNLSNTSVLIFSFMFSSSPAA